MSSIPPLLISKFDVKLISLLITECFGGSFPDISTKKQIHYIKNYLERLGCKTIVCETSYIDKWFLYDYGQYFLKCFADYPSSCSRLHFFSHEFDIEKFNNSLFSSSPDQSFKDELSESYLGFMVVKPIPRTFIGRTCLRLQSDVSSVNEPSSGLKVAITKRQNVNLMGVELALDSVPFQEQDKVLSACATTALWTLASASNYTNLEEIPSQSQITLDAIGSTSASINGFPNKGLTNSEVIRALEGMGLKQHEIKLKSTDSQSLEFFESHLKAYIDSSIPLFMGCEVYKKKGDDYEKVGEHAVVVLGYKKAEAGSVERIYIHDDRVGPYVRANSISEVKIQGKCFYGCFSISIDEAKDTNQDLSYISKEQILKPTSLNAVTYPKIRVPFQIVNYTCLDICEPMNLALSKASTGSPEYISFTTKVISSSSFKSQCLENEEIENKQEVLTTRMSRYVWVATFRLSGEKQFELVFDSTDIPQGQPLLCCVFYRKALSLALFGKVNEDYENMLPEDLNPDEFESFYISVARQLAELVDRKDSHNSKLDKLFGELRPPKSIEETETEHYGPIVQQGIRRLDISSDLKGKRLFDIYEDANSHTLIWVIDQNGTLIIGKDFPGANKKGHPTLVGGKPARVAGELYKDNQGFYINHFSGRYSSTYSPDDKNGYMENALARFKDIFRLTDQEIRIDNKRPD